MKTRFLAFIMAMMCIANVQADYTYYQNDGYDTCCDDACYSCCDPIRNALAFSTAWIGYSTGEFIGIDDDYAEVGIFAPLYLTCDTNFFFEGTGYRFNNSRYASSLGFGLRKRFCEGDVGGVNFFWDSYGAKCNKTFDRLGVGLEWLGCLFDARVNGYFSVGDTTRSCHCKVFNDYIGNFRATCKMREFSIANGFDAEIGVPFLCKCNFTIYGAAGPYFYSGKNQKRFWGGQARLEVDWHQIITLQVRTSYDRIYHSRTQGQIFLSLPFEVFCGNFCCLCDDALLRPVYRNDLIFTKECCSFTWNW